MRLLLTTFLAAGLAACAESPPTRGPRAELTTATLDFGVVEPCATVRQRVQVHNSGGLPLQLDFAGSGCGISATPAAARVEAGQVTTFEVALDTCPLSGAVAQSLIVFTNDPTQRTLRVALRGRVDADVAVVPPSLYVGHLRRGQDAALDAKLLIEPGISVRNVVPEGPFVEAQVRSPARGTTVSRLHLRIRRDAPYGRFHETLHLQSTSRQRPTLDVPVIGFVDQG